MVEGIFREGALRVSLVIFAANEQQHTLECLIDTGFAGQLKLSPYWVGILQLPKFGEERFRMADGRWGVHEIYRAQILWGEVEQEIEVVQMVGEPLVGIELLQNHHLDARLVEGGTICLALLDDIL